MAHPYWPLFDLRIRTPRLEIRAPTDEDLMALLAVMDDGIHDPATMPFLHPFTDTEPPQRHRDSLQFWWGTRARWHPDDWTYTGAVFVDGRPVGVQDLMATSFGELGSVKTGSWLGRAHQGQGLGKEMRAAILHLAFAGLGASEALSGAFADNAASLATSRALGYVDNGERLQLRRGVPARCLDLRLDRATWERTRRPDIDIIGLDGCRPLFGPEPATDEGRSGAPENG